MKGVKVSVDLREFQRALNEYEKHSSRDLQQLVKSAAVDVAFKAYSEADAAKKGNFPKLASGLYNSLAATGATRFGKAVRGKGNKAIAKKIFDARNTSVFYSKALFLTMAGQLGAKMRKTRKRVKNATATERKSNVRPFVTLKIEGVEDSHARDILTPAMQRGVDRVAKKYFDKVAKKLAQRAKQYSGRKV